MPNKRKPNAGHKNTVPHKWKPGQTGNPKGRPKGALCVKTVLRKWLEAKTKELNPITGKPGVMSQMDHMVLALIKKAKVGDTSAFNALFDRYEGKPTQTLVAEDEKGEKKPITVTLNLGGK